MIYKNVYFFLNHLILYPSYTILFLDKVIFTFTYINVIILFTESTLLFLAFWIWWTNSKGEHFKEEVISESCMAHTFISGSSGLKIVK